MKSNIIIRYTLMMIEIPGNHGMNGTANVSQRCATGWREIRTKNDTIVKPTATKTTHDHQTPSYNSCCNVSMHTANIMLTVPNAAREREKNSKKRKKNSKQLVSKKTMQLSKYYHLILQKSVTSHVTMAAVSRDGFVTLSEFHRNR